MIHSSPKKRTTSSNFILTGPSLYNENSIATNKSQHVRPNNTNTVTECRKRKDRKVFMKYGCIIFMYNVVLLTIYLHRSKVMRNLMIDSSHDKHTNTVSESIRLVKQSAFTNMLPTNVQSKKKRKEKTTPSEVVTLNLYDIYKNDEEIRRRSTRFPSIEQRLKVYMSTWYIPPCPNNIEGKVQYKYVSDYNNKKTSKLTVLFKPSTNSEMNEGQASFSSSSTSRELTKRQKVSDITTTTTSMQLVQDNITFLVDNTVSHERHFILYDQNLIDDCTDPFCVDVVKFINPSLKRIMNHTNEQQQQYIELPDQDRFPIFLQFGDAEAYRAYVPSLQKDVYSPMVPILRKFRYAMTSSDIERITSVTTTDITSVETREQQCYESGQNRLVAGTIRNPIPKTQAIISIVSNYPRHFEPLNHVNTADTKWEQKYDMAVYRGALTGRNKADYKSTDLKFCEQVPRCNLVYQHGNSSIIDAKLVPYGKMKYPLSDPLNGIKMFGNPMSMDEMLKYKAIIMLEGNDVSSGLKWALFSNSVVLTQTPTCTSWAMEELLQPWVHYIPINDNLSDVEEKVQWVLDHDVEAQTIARNGRLWIADLVYHPDADKDNEDILDETLKRYSSHFTYSPTLDK
jgi:hypothetical protein